MVNGDILTKINLEIALELHVLYVASRNCKRSVACTSI